MCHVIFCGILSENTHDVKKVYGVEESILLYSVLAMLIDWTLQLVLFLKATLCVFVFNSKCNFMCVFVFL